MNTSNISEKYTKVAVALHWIIALLIIGQLALGLWMGTLPKDPPGLRSGWFNLHKSWGILIGTLIFIRVLWRVTHRPPALPESLAVWQRKLSHAVHHLLYVLMVVVPLSGFLGSAYSKYPIKFFGQELPRCFEPDASLKELFSNIHTVTTWILMALLVLHIAAALKHRFIDRDNIFQRMSFKR